MEKFTEDNRCRRRLTREEYCRSKSLSPIRGERSQSSDSRLSQYYTELVENSPNKKRPVLDETYIIASPRNLSQLSDCQFSPEYKGLYSSFVSAENKRDLNTTYTIPSGGSVGGFILSHNSSARPLSPQPGPSGLNQNINSFEQSRICSPRKQSTIPDNFRNQTNQSRRYNTKQSGLIYVNRPGTTKYKLKSKGRPLPIDKRPPWCGSEFSKSNPSGSFNQSVANKCLFSTPSSRSSFNNQKPGFQENQIPDSSCGRSNNKDNNNPQLAPTETGNRKVWVVPVGRAPRSKTAIVNTIGVSELEEDPTQPQFSDPTCPPYPEWYTPGVKWNPTTGGYEPVYDVETERGPFVSEKFKHLQVPGKNCANDLSEADKQLEEQLFHAFRHLYFKSSSPPKPDSKISQNKRRRWNTTGPTPRFAVQRASKSLLEAVQTANVKDCPPPAMERAPLEPQFFDRSKPPYPEWETPNVRWNPDTGGYEPKYDVETERGCHISERFKHLQVPGRSNDKEMSSEAERQLEEQLFHAFRHLFHPSNVKCSQQCDQSSLRPSFARSTQTSRGSNQYSDKGTYRGQSTTQPVETRHELQLPSVPKSQRKQWPSSCKDSSIRSSPPKWTNYSQKSNSKQFREETEFEMKSMIPGGRKQWSSTKKDLSSNSLPKWAQDMASCSPGYYGGNAPLFELYENEERKWGKNNDNSGPKDDERLIPPWARKATINALSESVVFNETAFTNLVHKSKPRAKRTSNIRELDPLKSSYFETLPHWIRRESEAEELVNEKLSLIYEDDDNNIEMEDYDFKEDLKQEGMNFNEMQSKYFLSKSKHNEFNKSNYNKIEIPSKQSKFKLKTSLTEKNLVRKISDNHYENPLLDFSSYNRSVEPLVVAPIITNYFTCENSNNCINGNNDDNLQPSPSSRTRSIDYLQLNYKNNSIPGVLKNTGTTKVTYQNPYQPSTSKPCMPSTSDGNKKNLKNKNNEIIQSFVKAPIVTFSKMMIYLMSPEAIDEESIKGFETFDEGSRTDKTTYEDRNFLTFIKEKHLKECIEYCDVAFDVSIQNQICLVKKKKDDFIKRYAGCLKENKANLNENDQIKEINESDDIVEVIGYIGCTGNSPRELEVNQLDQENSQTELDDLPQ